MATKYNNIFLFSEVLLHVLFTLKSIHPSLTLLALGQNHLLIILKARFDHRMNIAERLTMTCMLGWTARRERQVYTG